MTCPNSWRWSSLPVQLSTAQSIMDRWGKIYPEHMLPFDTPTIYIHHCYFVPAQYDYYSNVYNNSILLRKPPPSTKGQTTMKTILETLPNVGETASFVALARLLSTDLSNFVSLSIIRNKDEEWSAKLLVTTKSFWIYSSVPIDAFLTGSPWQLPWGALWWPCHPADD